MSKNKKRLIVIDSNSIIHRAFHALPPLTTKKEELVNAVYGFLLVFIKAVKEFRPDFIVACFDLPAPTFRHKKFKEYKAKRPPTPKDLISQIVKVKEVLSVFNVPILEKEGFEADDIIGTISKRFSENKEQDMEVIILSGDLDNFQLVDDKTKVYFLKQGVKNTVLYNKEMVEERYSGLSPSQLVDLRALRGDASDNIPGVRGIGEKTAISLLTAFGTIEKLYDQLNSSKKIKPKVKELLTEQKEQAFLSKELAKIQTDVPMDFSLEQSEWKKYDKDEAVKKLQSFEFYSLIKRLAEIDEKEYKAEKELRLW
jgi:DNA polymerase-1